MANEGKEITMQVEKTGMRRRNGRQVKETGQQNKTVRQMKGRQVRGG